MGSHTSLFPLSCLCLFLLLLEQTGMLAEARFQHDQLNDFKPTKLFVFGDSYVDTGNTGSEEPYGITNPGYPDGRWSDGRILTDFIAHYLGLKSSRVPYNKSDDCPGDLKYGMNFAFGGTGVFDIPDKGPNMTAQIDLFQQIIKDNVYNASDLNNSVAYVSAAGNDYMNYFKNPGSSWDIGVFILKVVYQISENLLRIQELGVKKIVVGDLPPLDCIPLITSSSSFTQCNATVDMLVGLHNLILTELNKGEKDSILILDLHGSFKSVINNSSNYNIQNPLTPCCVGVSGGDYYCGSVDKGENKYKVCDKPESAFYWDVVHPTQAGWKAVYNELQRNGALQVFYGTNGHTSY